MVLQIIPVGRAVVSERYSYIPYIGIFFIFGKFLSDIKENKFLFSTKFKPFVLPIITALCLFYSYLTFERNKEWKNGIVIFTDVINKYPEQGFGWWARGNAEAVNKDFNLALSDFDKSISLGCSDASLFTSRGISKVNLGNFDSALPDFNLAIKLNPQYAEARFNRGTLSIYTGKYELALDDLNFAIKLKPDYVDAYCNRGAAYAYLKRMNESLKEFNKAIEINPKYAEAYFSRGFTKRNLNDKQGACSDWNISLQLGCEKAKNALEKYCM